MKLSVLGIGGTFEGKLNTEGDSIAGNWTQGPQPLPRTLKRPTNVTAWTILEPPAPPKPMAADANPALEVATIKPSKPDAVGKGFRVNGRRFTTINTSLSDLMTFAYGLHARGIRQV